jgi:glycosyltransferase involved in cell wall biosynthesis
LPGAFLFQPLFLLSCNSHKQPSLSAHIYFTVTNDLSYDQRMHRICHSLATSGFSVTLVGRRLKRSLPLAEKSFKQKRIRCFFNKGPLFYAEYNTRLFFFLLTKKLDGICAIDLDTILPGLFISKLKNIPRIYDAHEYFTELKEVRTRPRVQKAWLAIERFAVPQFDNGYTVSDGLAEAFQKKYKRDYPVIRNLPVLQPLVPVEKNEKFLVYQGAVNEARGFEYLIPAMKSVRYKLVVCGDGNFMEPLKQLIEKYEVSSKVELKGMLVPAQLRAVAQEATLGMALSEKEGLNQLYALPNKFLENMHAGLPQIAMDFPEYTKINSRYRIAVLLSSLDVAEIADTINRTMADDKLLDELRANALKAREEYCWQREQDLLIDFYKRLFP